MCHLLLFYSAHSMGHNKNPKLSKRNLTKVIWCKKSAGIYYSDFILRLSICCGNYFTNFSGKSLKPIDF